METQRHESMMTSRTLHMSPLGAANILRPQTHATQFHRGGKLMQNLLTKTVVAFAVAALAMIVTMQFTAKPAMAHCTLYHPAHCVEEVIEDPADALIRDRPSESPSCFAVWTHEDYEFSISNEANTVVYYSINGDSYSISAGGYQSYSYPQARGSNSCNTEYYNRPQIEYDSSYVSGYQEQSYGLDDNGAYKFERSGDSLNLYIATASSTSTGSGSGQSSSSHIAYGNDVNGQVTSSGGNRYTFSGTAGQWVEITMSSSSMDSYLELYGPSGTLIASDDDSGGGDRGLNSRIYVSSLPETGTFTIVARDYYGNTGSFYLTLD
jgi:hypothetical protein